MINKHYVVIIPTHGTTSQKSFLIFIVWKYLQLSLCFDLFCINLNNYDSKEQIALSSSITKSHARVVIRTKICALNLTSCVYKLRCSKCIDSCFPDAASCMHHWWSRFDISWKKKNMKVKTGIIQIHLHKLSRICLNWSNQCHPSAWSKTL